MLAHRGDMQVPAQILASIAVLVNIAIDCTATGAFNSVIGRAMVTLLMAQIRCFQVHQGWADRHDQRYCLKNNTHVPKWLQAQNLASALSPSPGQVETAAETAAETAV